MKKILLTLSVLSFSILVAQNNRIVNAGFDETAALQEAKNRGLQAVDYAGYVKNKYNAWLKANGSLLIDKKTVASKKILNAVSSATNMDFETGNYSGWTVLAGENMVNSNGPLTNIHAVTPGGTDSLPTSCNLSDTTIRHGLMTNGNTDPICGVPLASPMGGNYVARLNRLCASFEGAMLVQTFPVAPGQTVLNYAYAVVLEDGGHAFGEQTYFKVLVKDVNGAIIDSVYMQAANGLTPGFYPVVGGNGYTYYKPWTPVSVDLTAYMGQNVTVEVTASDCIYGGHSGYAYFDARLDSTSAIPNVWPGDANYDLTADMNDLLYLGWAFGATGPGRPSATNNWQAEASTNWGQTTAYGTEFKHADCNGDGVIDLNDTLAIYNNYGLQHAFRMGQTNQISAQSNYRNLQVTSNLSTCGPNQVLKITIALPTNTVTTNDLYGIAFRMSVPSQYISALTSADFSGSFLGVKGSNMMTLSKAFIGQDHIDLSLVRNDKMNATTGGTLVDIYFTSTNFSTNGVGHFNISNINAVTYQGAYLPIGYNGATVNFSNSSGIQKNIQAEIRIVPNPASDKISLDGLNDNHLAFEILNIVGQPLVKGYTDNKKTIDISAFENGAYFIKLNTAQGPVIRKFIKE